MRKLKELDGTALKAAIKDELGEHYTSRIDDSIHFAETMHAGQTRKDPVQGRVDTDYVEHCFRNALRMIRLGLTDANIIIAINFHDVVEDCAPVFAPGPEPQARESLRGYIQLKYGPEVLSYVDGVTNPYEPREARDAMSELEKAQAYQQQVGEKIRRSVGIYITKFTDLVDNAGSLHHAPADKAKRTSRLARKYAPMIPIFIEVGRMWAERYPDLIDWAEVEAILVRIGERLEVLR